MLANCKLASKVFAAKEPIIMKTDTGEKKLDEEAQVPGFGDGVSMKMAWQTHLD